jgi:hypothetical protein
MMIDGFHDWESRLRHLFEMLGCAVWQVQQLENTLASYVTIRLRDSRGVGLERGLAIDHTEQRRTLGSVARELAESGVLLNETAGELERIRTERNWMVHRLSREAQGVLDIRESYFCVLTRLQWTADASLALSKQLGREIEEYVVKAGVSPEFIEKEARRLLRSWGLDHLI